jgi:aromatic ring-cleaving dioxygenase
VLNDWIENGVGPQDDVAFQIAVRERWHAQLQAFLAPPEQGDQLRESQHYQAIVKEAKMGRAANVQYCLAVDNGLQSVELSLQRFL